MADLVWYAARGDVEKGPFSTAQIKALAANGRLRKDDLVWKEGMPDWKSAGEIPGLFADEPPVAPAPGATGAGASSDSAVAPKPAGDAGSKVGPAKATTKTPIKAEAKAEPKSARPAAGTPAAANSDQPVAATPDPTPVPTPPGVDEAVLDEPDPPSFFPEPAVAIHAGGSGTSVGTASVAADRRPPSFTIAGMPWEQFALYVGLCLVIGAKGCDAIGQRAVSRHEARLSVVRNRFEDDHQQAVEKLQERQTELRGVANPSNEQRQELSRIPEQLTELSRTHREERSELESGRWRDLTIAARDAEANRKMWGVWRESAFVAGTLVLMIGLLTLGFNGHGPERWVCLIMIAIITFSLYVGGAAWVLPFLNQ